MEINFTMDEFKADLIKQAKLYGVTIAKEDGTPKTVKEVIQDITDVWNDMDENMKITVSTIIDSLE